MATPLSADRLLTALRGEGCKVVEYRSWRTHNRNHVGAWGSVQGVMIHHTVTSGTDNSVRLCYDGHTSLPGPLCHSVIAKDGRVFMVGHGRANHAGAGDPGVLAAVIDERALPADRQATTDGNARFYGAELINLGDGKDPWPEAQIDAAARWAAGICRAHGWSERSVIGHLEWQPGKVDPRGFSMDDFRARVRKILAAKPGTSTPAPAPTAPAPTPTTPAEKGLDMDAAALYRAVWEQDKAKAPSSSTTRATNPTWQPISLLRETYDRVTELRAAVEAQAATIGELARALAARDAAVDVDALVARIQTAIEGVTVRLDAGTDA